jgi:hypothetical protein
LPNCLERLGFDSKKYSTATTINTIFPENRIFRMKNLTAKYVLVKPGLVNTDDVRAFRIYYSDLEND